MPYDATRDFVPIVNVATAPSVLVVAPAAPYGDLAGLIWDSTDRWDHPLLAYATNLPALADVENLRWKVLVDRDGEPPLAREQFTDAPQRLRVAAESVDEEGSMRRIRVAPRQRRKFNERHATTVLRAKKKGRTFRSAPAPFVIRC